MKINEIFYSLQGEGYWTGTPMVFVRFSGCNLQCPFCDTEHETFTEMTEDEILAEIEKYPTKHVCLTGGEPCLQVTEEFVDKIQKTHRRVHIETNGTLPFPENAIWVTVSPKGAPARDYCSEVKLLYPCPDPEEYTRIKALRYYLQPIATPDPEEKRRNLESTIDYIKEHPNWQLSLQTHKYIGIQ